MDVDEPEPAPARPRAESLEEISQKINTSSFELDAKSSRATTTLGANGHGNTKRYSNGAKPITRNRASYSCHACRRRKVKCDKVHPICGNCSKIGDECTYDAAATKAEKTSPSSNSTGTEERHGTKRRRKTLDAAAHKTPSVADETSGQSTPAEPRSIEARLDFLTSMVEKLSRNSALLGEDELEQISREGSALVEAHSSKGNAVKAKARRQAVGTKTPLDQEVVTTESSRPDTPGVGERGNGNEAADPVAALNLGHLSLQDGGRSRYVGTTFWAYVSDEIDQLNQLLRDQNRAISPEAPTHSYGDPVHEVRTSQRNPQQTGEQNSFQKESKFDTTTSSGFTKSMLFQTEDSPMSSFDELHAAMFQNMPTKRQSHVLYRCFMSGVHIISPIIHPPSVLEQYHAFWEWFDNREKSNESVPDPSFIPLLYAIWYGGSVSISIKGIKKEFGDTTRASLSARLHDEVTRCLTLVAFPRNPSVSGLAAFLIVQTILAREEEPLTSSLFIGLAVRTAQMMGLHRDPAQFGLPAAHAEARRRMWWHIVHMDGVVALSSGLPPLVSDESYWDVKEISELKDAYIGTAEAEQYEIDIADGKRKPDIPDEPLARVRHSMVDVSYVVAKGKGIMAKLTRRILRLQLGTRALTRKDMSYLRSCLNEAERQLSAIVKRIPTRGMPEMCLDPSAKNYKHHPFEYDPALATNPTAEELRQFSGISPVGWLNNYTVDYHFNNLKAFHKWARILLSLFIDKAYCVTYQPFLKNVKSKIWPSARQCALRHCHGFMKKFIALATDPAFQSFQWSWPGNHQPMHATMIMLIDLYERPNSPEAPRSRAFIDQVFSLSGPDGGVVGGEDGVSVQRPLREGGREAWMMLRRLREKAWQKAGLDPAMLWTEQDQIEAGIAKPLSQHELMVRELREGSLTTAALEGKIDVADLMRSLNAEEGDFEDESIRPGPSLAHGLYSLIKQSQKQSDDDFPPFSTRQALESHVRRPPRREGSMSSSRSARTGVHSDSITSPSRTISPPAGQSLNGSIAPGSPPQHEPRTWPEPDPMTEHMSDLPQQHTSPAVPQSQPKAKSSGSIPFQPINRNRPSTLPEPSPYIPQAQSQQQQPLPRPLYQGPQHLDNNLTSQKSIPKSLEFLDGMDVTAATAARSSRGLSSSGIFDNQGTTPKTRSHILSPPLTSRKPLSSPQSTSNNVNLPMDLPLDPTPTDAAGAAATDPIPLTTDMSNNNINVNFDWDQWDAVFGQYALPLDDYDYMNMDLDLDEQQLGGSGFLP